MKIEYYEKTNENEIFVSSLIVLAFRVTNG